ncbi:MAG TPA: kelch repeat-containing protein [Kofleriaceae bacterium]|jgi:hypothetical protein|nr:kelch repeat-containing protein [Kofleriaceae bacterium]
MRLAALAVVAGLAAAATGSAGCGGTTGTVQVTLATAPDSTVLDGVQTLRLTLTDPRQVTVAQRTSTGFDLALEVDAGSQTGALIVEGLDASGALVACGQSPAFPIGAINARITVYVAAPLSIAAAPVGLTAPRSEIAGAALSFGAVLAGGRDANGAPTADIAIYNAFDHTFIAGLGLPAARTGPAMVAGTGDGVYLFGGTGPDGVPTGTLWLFDTTVAPSGAYTTLADDAQFARTGERALAVGLITGTPGLSFDGSATVTAVTAVASLPAAAAVNATPAAVFVGDSLIRFRQGMFDTIPGDGRTGAGAVALPSGKIAVVGGGAPLAFDALLIDPDAATVTSVPDVLVTARANPAIAATSRYVVVAGGTDATGAPIGSAEVLDATTLAPITTIAIPAVAGAVAIALPDDQVLLAGGTPGSADLLLFTPDPPPL